VAVTTPCTTLYFTQARRHAFISNKSRKVRANAYDMVLNGNEIGGGSIRIHDKATQQLMFKYLGFTEEQAKEQFGFLMDAFQFGAPPHGGLALIRSISCHSWRQETIRDFIAFPKITQEETS
jgi:aspartyl-tRNA synthetase